MLHENYPQIHLKGWTAVEINWFEFQTKKIVRWVLEDMRSAGLGSMPGGGAEIFHPEVRDQICEHKANTHAWLDIHRTAHEIGPADQLHDALRARRKAYHRIDHLMRLRELQDETGGFQVFIPLAFHPENTKLDHLKKPSALMDLRTMAVSRLMLDNIQHIKAYWIMLGIEHGTNGARLRCRRHRRHGASRTDLSRRRRDDAGVLDGRTNSAADCRGRSRTDRARHDLPSRPARSGRLFQVAKLRIGHGRALGGQRSAGLAGKHLVVSDKPTRQQRSENNCRSGSC